LVAKLGKGFGMTVYAYDPFVPEIDMKNEGVIPCANEKELYSKSQYLSVHLPLNDKTKNHLGYDLLSQMPKGAMLVNTARKEIVDEAALLKVYAERTDFRYASDVEPDCKEELNTKYAGRFYFTPKKMGAQTAEANNNAGLAAARQIVSFLKTGDKTFQVNK
jgi:D-3-phosphoglycerate dehydrogenase / 2-oxoglutarate reductase